MIQILDTGIDVRQDNLLRGGDSSEGSRTATDITAATPSIGSAFSVSAPGLHSKRFTLSTDRADKRISTGTECRLSNLSIQDPAHYSPVETTKVVTRCGKPHDDHRKCYIRSTADSAAVEFLPSRILPHSQTFMGSAGVLGYAKFLNIRIHEDVTIKVTQGTPRALYHVGKALRL